MSHSKAANILYSVLAIYLRRQYNNPVLTKAITSSVLAALGNILAQKLSGKKLNPESIIAFILFGGFVYGPMSHHFYLYMRLLTKDPWKIFLIERFLYTPAFLAFTLYMLNIFQGKFHKESYVLMKQMYLSIVQDNLQLLTVPHYLNIKYVPPMLKGFGRDFIAFLWFVHLTHKRANLLKKKV